MRYLLFNSCLLLLLGCSSAYKNLQPASGDASVLQKFRPLFSVALYKAGIAVTGNELSGLLLIKKMPDSSTRLVFSNELGVTFFDFEFSAEGEFKVHSILKKMDKKAVITTLRKDFELVLMNHIANKNVLIRKRDGLIYYTYVYGKDHYHYITDEPGNQLVRMERASKRKTVMQAMMKNYQNGIPDTIGITHQNFNFTIGLKRLER